MEDADDMVVLGAGIFKKTVIHLARLITYIPLSKKCKHKPLPTHTAFQTNLPPTSPVRYSHFGYVYFVDLGLPSEVVPGPGAGDGRRGGSGSQHTLVRGQDLLLPACPAHVRVLEPGRGL